MLCRKLRSKSLVLTLLSLITLYGLISFLYLEVGIMVRGGNVLHIAGVRFDMMKFRGGVSKDLEHVCPVNSIPAAHRIPYSNDITCKSHVPSKAACTYAENFYKYEFSKWKCEPTQEIRICELHSNHEFVCDYSVCGPAFNGEVVMHVFDSESGIVRPLQRGFYNNEELNENVMKYAQSAMREGYPFLFLSCGLDEKQTQLLMFDKTILGDSPSKTQKELANININIVLFDSISRAHFYRSLKQTINFFREVNTKPSYKAEILDFELFQSIHGHTTENLYALMNGKIFPPSLSDLDKENAKTELDNLLKYFKSRDYEILYQEDECWQGLWGLNSDLGNFENWTDFRAEVTKNTSIDDTGLLFASCKMIDLYEPERKHIFNTDGDVQICYNGWNLDTYYFQYLTNKFQVTKNKNLFSFTAVNIAHDGTGRRVQGIDADLKTFFKDMTEQDNTITILFGDHGNTYSDYVYVDIEGRYEMYHPALFIVVPQKVQMKLGEQKMHALRMNQKRLMTLVDVHNMIKHIVDPTDHPQNGLLEILPGNRSCETIPMGVPNLCICEGWDSPVKNTTEFMPYVDFAMGQLNNLINAVSKYGQCKRLVPTRFENVLQRKTTESVSITFDIYTTPGKGSKNTEEQIHVEMNYAVSQQNSNFNTKLVSFDRISTFGSYRKCSDAFGKFRFCVCDDVKEHKKLTNIQDLLPIRNEYVYTKIFGDLIEEDISYIEDNKLALLERKLYEYNERTNEKVLVSVTFEAISIVDITYEVELTFENSLQNMKPMAAEGCKGLVKKHGMTFLCSVMRIWSIGPASYTYKYSFNELTGLENDVLFNMDSELLHGSS